MELCPSWISLSCRTHLLGIIRKKIRSLLFSHHLDENIDQGAEFQPGQSSNRGNFQPGQSYSQGKEWTHQTRNPTCINLLGPRPRMLGENYGPCPRPRMRGNVPAWAEFQPGQSSIRGRFLAKAKFQQVAGFQQAGQSSSSSGAEFQPG